MSIHSSIPARASAAEMIARYDGHAASEAALQVNARIAANDIDGALAMDRVRPAIIHLTGR